MVSKEEFNKVFKDTSREGILNQFYYEHKKLQEVLSVLGKVKELIAFYETIRGYYEYEDNGYWEMDYEENIKEKALEILDKVKEI